MIVLVLGNVGSGKTLFLTIFSQLSSRKVFTNYEIIKSNKEIHRFKIRDILDEKIDKSDVYLDEFYLYMDSRHFMNDINSLLSYFAFQSRKLGLRIFLSTQIVRTIDIRMREMIDILVECEKIEVNGVVKGYKYTIYTGVNSNDYIKPKQLFLSFNTAKEFFDNYNTYEIIKTPLFEDIKRNVASSEYTEKEKFDIAKECIRFLQKNKLSVTKTNVGVFLIDNDYSTKQNFRNSIYAKCIICKSKGG